MLLLVTMPAVVKKGRRERCTIQKPGPIRGDPRLRTGLRLVQGHPGQWKLSPFLCVLARLWSLSFDPVEKSHYFPITFPSLLSGRELIDLNFSRTNAPPPHRYYDCVTEMTRWHP